MDDNLVGLAAVILIFGIPPALMYTYYCVRKLRTEERLPPLPAAFLCLWRRSFRRPPCRAGRAFCW